MEQNEEFPILTKIAYPDLSRKLENWLFLESFFIHCRTVKVSQNDQIQMQTWFTSGFLMNGTELRCFSHFQILTKIAYPDLSRKLENLLFLEFFFIHCKTVKVSQNDQIQMQTWFTSGFLMNGTELRSFSHFQILTKIAYPDLSRKLENWLFLEFFFIHCKTVEVSQNDQIQMQTWFTSGFLMNGTELRSFSHFQILTLAEILKIDWFWCLPSFPVKLWKSVKMIKFEYKHDSEAVSWWMDKN